MTTMRAKPQLLANSDSNGNTHTHGTVQQIEPNDFGNHVEVG